MVSDRARVRNVLAWPLALLAWFIPHAAAAGWLVSTWPFSRPRSITVLLAWGLVAAPMAGVLLHDVVVGGADLSSRRWAVALDVIWIGLVMPWLLLARRPAVTAATIVLVVAASASLGSALRWLQPTWVQTGTNLAFLASGSAEPVSEWVLQVTSVGGQHIAVDTVEGAPIVADSEQRVLLRGSAIAEAVGDGGVRWPSTPFVALSATWSDGTGVAGRTFRVVGGFDARVATNPRGCRGWRIGWWVDGQLVETCQPIGWPAGPVEVARAATIPDAAEGANVRFTWFDTGGLELRWTHLRVEERIGEGWFDVTGGLSPGAVEMGAPVVHSRDRRSSHRVEVVLPLGVHPADVFVVSADEGMLLQGGQLPRWSGWSSHANVMAHLVLIAMATVMVVSRNLMVVAGAALAGLSAIAMTGSRSGLIAAVLVVAGTALWRTSGAWRWVLVTLAALSAVVASVSSDRLGTLMRLSGPEENLLSRWEIVHVSLAAIRRAPWTGETNGIIDYAMTELGLVAPALPGHAHNLWLEMGALYGVPAFVGVAFATMWLLLWALRADRGRRLTLVVPVFIVSLTDITLLVPMIAVPFAIALLVLSRDGDLVSRPP